MIVDGVANAPAIRYANSVTVVGHLALDQDGSWFYAVETVTNPNKLGPVYNMVQHPTFRPPLLDETALVDSNATKRSIQNPSMPNPEERSVVWPNALRAGKAINLRHLTYFQNPRAVSYVIDGISWVNAVTVAKGLRIGHVWRTDEYS